MKILTAEQVREWDAFTMQHEPVSSINLMERAASSCVEWITTHFPETRSFSIFCGKGNNGGDGLAVARMLLGMQYHVTVYILEFGFLGTSEFQENLARLHNAEFTNIHFIQAPSHFPVFDEGDLIIDALFGTGLNRKLEGITEELVTHINESGKIIISIDIPSGLYADRSAKGTTFIHASYTLAFQCYKLAFLLPENAIAVGSLYILDIGLHREFVPKGDTSYEYIDHSIVKAIYKPRDKFAHKGNFGHALLVAGSYGKMGAAILSAKACLRSGVGLLTCHVPASGNSIMQAIVPESMVDADKDDYINTLVNPDTTKYAAIGIGPGIGTSNYTASMVRNLLVSDSKPIVLDADALNILAENKDHLNEIPAGSILTPHPGEFERLFGPSGDDFERVSLALQKSRELDVVIVLKGHHTLIAAAGKGYFNSTGNAGMATGGSGDVLTGMITGLLAQGYSSIEAAILGVYLHGLAGDIASQEYSQEALIAGDIVHSIGKAFQNLEPGQI